MQKSKSMVTLAAGLLAGSMVGIGAALVSAPRPGKRSRAVLAERTNLMKQQTVGSLQAVGSRASYFMMDLSSRINLALYRPEQVEIALD